MTRAELRTRIWQRLDEPADGTGYYSAAEAHWAIDRAQRLFVLLSLCLEDTQTLALTGGTAWQHVRSTLANWLRPLRLTLSGTKLRPATLAQLSGYAYNWEASEGSPTRYAHLGQDLLAVYSHPAAAGTSLSAVYAYQPLTLDTDAAVPEIPIEYHGCLIDGAIAFLRLKEGLLEQKRFQRFLEAAGKANRYVRARSLDLRYDTLPPELDRFDLSRLLGNENRSKSPWQTTSQ